MRILLRFLALAVYWIGIHIQTICMLFKPIKREKIPQSQNEILTFSARKLVEKLKSGQISSEELVRQYIIRIKEVNPILNAVIDDRFTDAVEEAMKADRVINLTADKNKLYKKYPLFGVPFTVKEACGVEGLSHVVGSHYRRGFTNEQDGAIVSIIRQAGGIPLLASANPEFCVSWETSTLTHGRCNNPYNTDYTPGGSSGGEGALNGAGASVFGIGSDLCGSVRIPALFSGVFGHKPTGALVSTVGHFPNVDEVGFEQLLQLGPITRFAEDLPLLLDVIAERNVSKLIKATNINEMKIFYMDMGWRLTTIPISDSIQKSIEKACNHFKSKGNEVQKLYIEEMNDTMEIVATTLLCFHPPNIHQNPSNPELKTTIISELKKHFTGKAKHSIQALYFQGLHDLSAMFPALRQNYYLERKEMIISKLQAALSTDGVLFFPTFHREAFMHNMSIIHSPGTVLSGLFNMIGFPSLHVPMGMNENGLPIGFQVVASPYADRNCFEVALELERVFGGWIQPS